MIDPNVLSDAGIQADMDAINRGEAIVDRQGGTAWINGRLWGYHTDNGRSYPVEGAGFIRLTQRHYSALKMIARYTGLNAESERELASRPTLTDDDREVVRRVWRMREEAED